MQASKGKISKRDHPVRVMQKDVSKGFMAMKVSGLLACGRTVHHRLIENNQTAFCISFWEADVQIYETKMQALLPLPPPLNPVPQRAPGWLP